MLVNMCGDIQFSEKNDYFRFRAQRRPLPFFGCFSFVAQVIRTLPLLLRFRGPHFSVALSAGYLSPRSAFTLIAHRVLFESTKYAAYSSHPASGRRLLYSFG